MVESGFLDVDFNNFFTFSGSWVWFFVKIHLLVIFIGISGFMVSFSENFLDLWVYFSEFLRIHGWYFYDLNGTNPHLGNSSDALERSGINIVLITSTFLPYSCDLYMFLHVLSLWFDKECHRYEHINIFPGTLILSIGQHALKGTPPSNDPAETLPRQGKSMTRQESVLPRQV